jgi:diguanylate cyclase (GGDEF)-like protein
VCKREARKTDLIARLGGDEFIILMEHIAPDQARQLADRLRAAIEKEFAATTAGTISGGVSGMLASDTSMEDVLRRADIALYEAKSQGRNRVRQL